MSYRICYNENPTMFEVTVPMSAPLQGLVNELSLILRETGRDDLLVHSLHISSFDEDGTFQYTMVTS